MREDFDPDWPHGHVTRDGRKARIVCKDRVSRDEPLVVLVDENSCESVYSYYRSGTFLFGEVSDYDLINAPAPKIKHERWINIYPGGECVDLHPSREVADRAAELRGGRIDCIHITWEE